MPLRSFREAGSASRETPQFRREDSRYSRYSSELTKAATYVSAAASSVALTPGISSRSRIPSSTSCTLARRRRVEFDRQRHELEERDHRVADDGHVEEHAGQAAGEEKSREHQDRHQARDKVRRRHQRHAEVQHRVAGLVLDGMAGLVRRHAQRRQAGAAVILGGQHQPLVERVVVIGQVAFGFATISTSLVMPACAITASAASRPVMPPRD